MTETLQRPVRPAPSRAGTPPAAARHPVASGALAALWAAVAGLGLVGLPVLLVWATDPRAGAGAAEALRAVALVWLVAHGTSVDLLGGTFGLTPLGLVLVPGLLLARAGAALGRGRQGVGLRAAALTAASVAVPYAVIAAVVAELAVSVEVVPSPVQALLAGLVVGGVGAGLGVVRSARLWPALSGRLPAAPRRVLVASTGAVGVLLAGGALLAGGSLAAHLGRAGELTGATSPGVVGGVGLLLVGLSLVPNAAVWGAAWLAGPGFAVGVGTAVGPFGHALGPVPALPLLAALPGSEVPGSWGVLALLVPLAAGAVAGGLLHRRLPREGLLRLSAEAAAAGPCAGLLLATLAWLSGGAAGGGRLAEVGPSPWQVGLAVSAEVAVGAVAGALLLRRRSARP